MIFSAGLTNLVRSGRVNWQGLMAGIHRLLAPDGILFLGSTEQPADPIRWTSVLAADTCYFRPRESAWR
jgi:hypothetical protein